MKHLLQTSEEIHRLREQCMIMANLLRDVAENESHLRRCTLGEPDNPTNRALDSRNARRRELVAEIEAALGSRGEFVTFDKEKSGGDGPRGDGLRLNQSKRSGETVC
jgi:hypothetical protein